MKIARRLLSTNYTSDDEAGDGELPPPPRSSASRRLLDHTVTHNIEMLKDVKEFERLSMLAAIEKYTDSFPPVTYLGRQSTVSQGPEWDGEDMVVRMVLNQLWWEWGGYEWTSHQRFPGKEWRKPAHYCTWFGISCNDKSQIVTIHLEANNLVGTLPEAIGELDTLTELHLGFNAGITGTVPESIGKLTKLIYLSISFCGITGNPPTGLKNLTSLIYLDATYLGDQSYYPVDLKDKTHTTGPEAQAWVAVHNSYGQLTNLTGYDPYCYGGPPCHGYAPAIGTYWAMMKLVFDLNPWTTRGRWGTINSGFYEGCEGEWCHEVDPGTETSPESRYNPPPKLDTVNSIYVKPRDLKLDDTLQNTGQEKGSTRSYNWDSDLNLYPYERPEGILAKDPDYLEFGYVDLETFTPVSMDPALPPCNSVTGECRL